LLVGVLAALAVYQFRALPLITEHVPASILHPLSLAGGGLFLAILVTLCGDWRRLRAGRREVRRLGQQDGDNWAVATLTDDLLAAGFPERFRALPASPEDAREAEEELDADCAAEFAGRVQGWTECLRRRWRRYWLLALLLLLPGLALTALGLRGSPLGPPSGELFLSLGVATAETVVVCLLALWLRGRWQQLLVEWRERAGMRETQLALFPDLVLPSGQPEGRLAVQPEAGTEELNGQSCSAGAEWVIEVEGEPVPGVEWSDLPAEPAVTSPAEGRPGSNPGPTKLATGKPTVLGETESPPPEEKRPQEAPWNGDLQLVEDDEG
jgi:hypothetical protein